MATATNPKFSNSRTRRVSPLALAFIQTIESSWKGHEQFGLWIIRKLRPRVVVDLGFDTGLSTVIFGYKNPGHVFAIDWFYEEGCYREKSVALDSAFINISRAIRLNYVKNVHLIIGPYRDVLKHWNRKIDLFHIAGARSYRTAKFLYEQWHPHLIENGVLLLHNVVLYPEVGQFFLDLPYPKFLFPKNHGLGVISLNEKIIQEIASTWGPV